MRAKLVFYYGSMSSSKTLRLLSTAHQLEESGVNIMVMKPSLDTRDGEGVIRSRAGLERKCVMVDDDVDLFKGIERFMEDTEEEFGRLKFVLVDECQFLTVKQVEQLSHTVDKLNVTVLCYGLRTDFRSYGFDASIRLFELADKIEEVKSMCECGENYTSINARFDEYGTIITDGEQVMVGGNDKYKALCRKCWEKYKRIKEDFNN